jgi:hypothetical protein
MPIKQPSNLFAGTQSVRLDVTLDPVRRDRAEGLAFGRDGRQPVADEAKFMLPWSFSEESAAEKYMPQLQHNMRVGQLFGVTAVFGQLRPAACHDTL